MRRLLLWFEKVRCLRWAPAAAGLAAAALYLVQALSYAGTLGSMLDEGNYLYKGLLYVRGVYVPFQPYGPNLNKMPFAFFIPGLVQDWFGPGLRTGRYFQIILALLMLLGLWIVVRRFGGRWWAAGVLWAIAINPALIQSYSQAISEGMVASMLVWVFVLVLGPDRPLWQVILGSLLAGVTVMTRENMVPLIALLVLYLWWERGWRFALVGALASLAVLLVVHVIYWPDIMTNWARQIPAKFSPFLKPFRKPVPGQQVWSQTDITLISRVYAFWDALRQQFVPFFSLLVAWALWPRRSAWKSPSHFRVSVSLSLFLVVMILAHAWASVLGNYCVFCLNLYLTFFGVTGFILLAASASSWQRAPSVFRQALAAVLAVGYFAGAGFGAHQFLDDFLLNIKIPRTRSMRILPGTTELWRSLYNKFGWSQEFQKYLLPTLASILVALLVMLLAFLLYRSWYRNRSFLGPGYLSLVLLLSLGAVLTPTPIFGYVINPEPCQQDILAAYDQAGAHLASLIPPGSLVYWKGGLSPVPLLYLEDRGIFPPQLNDGYTLRRGGDPDAVYRLGFWNQELSRQWLSQADFALFEKSSYNGALDGSKEYEELQPTNRLGCSSGSEIRVFRRLK